MPQFVRLDRETTAELFAKPEPKPKKREEWARQREEYKAYLKSVGEGESGKLVLAEDEAKSTVRARLNTAAEALGFALEYKRTRTNDIIFQIAKAEAPAEAEAQEAKPKRARKKKEE